MSWKEKAKEFGSANLLFLSADGASINFIVADDPVLLEGTYNKKVQERVGCPIVTSEGFQLFIVGKRCFRKITSLEDKFKDHVINVTRHGVEGDTDTTYEVTALSDAAMFKQLVAIRAKTYSKEVLAEAIAESKDVISR